MEFQQDILRLLPEADERPFMSSRIETGDEGVYSDQRVTLLGVQRGGAVI